VQIIQPAHRIHPNCRRYVELFAQQLGSVECELGVLSYGEELVGYAPRLRTGLDIEEAAVGSFGCEGLAKLFVAIYVLLEGRVAILNSALIHLL
jgi:hypothetical protein